MSTEYLDKNGLEQVWDKIKTKIGDAEMKVSHTSMPDVNLFLEYSTYTGDNENCEYGLGGMTYIGNSQYVFYVRNKDTNGNCGKLVCVDASTKKFLWRTTSFKGYHGNTVEYVGGKYYLSAAQDDEDNYIQKYIVFTPGSISDGVMSGSASVSADLSLGGNIAYDRDTETFYSSVGKNIGDGQRKGDIYKWSGIFGEKSEDVLNLVDENSDNEAVVDLITNGWYQGCCIVNGVFYQLYWRTHNIIAAFDLSTGAYIKSWNLPTKSNFCKVMNEIQGITYNYDTDQFVVCSTTYTERLYQCPIVNISEVGLYKSLQIVTPSRIYAIVATGTTYEDHCFVAYIEIGSTGFRTNNSSLTDSPFRDDCTPCCDRYDVNGDVQFNKFRSLRDADYAYECYNEGGGKIKYVFMNTFNHNNAIVSSAPFFKPCVITPASGHKLTMISPIFTACQSAYICGESSSNPVLITGGGAAGYPEKNTSNKMSTTEDPVSLIKVGNGNELGLQNVTFQKDTGYSTVLYGAYVYENGHLTVGENVTLDTSVYTQTGCRVAMYDTMPNKLFIATSATAAGTAAKEADINDTTDSASFSLRTGIRVAVRFTAGNSATTPTLNINGTGAKSIAYPTSATAVATGNGTTYNRWGPNETVIFTYNGTYWVREATSLTSYLAYSTARSADSTAADAYEMAEDATTTLSSMLQLKTYTYAYSSLASGGALVIKGSDFPSPGITTPSGYTPVAALKVLTGNNNVVPRSWDASATGSTAAVCIRNVSTSAQSGTVTFTILYAKSGVVAS